MSVFYPTVTPRLSTPRAAQGAIEMLCGLPNRRRLRRGRVGVLGPRGPRGRMGGEARVARVVLHAGGPTGPGHRLEPRTACRLAPQSGPMFAPIFGDRTPKNTRWQMIVTGSFQSREARNFPEEEGAQR